MNKDEALEIALDYIRRTSHWEKGRDRHDTLKAVEAALAQPWPDLTKRDRESYQKGHNDGVAHHKQSVKAAQPVQEPYDQTALELCNVCGWKTLIPDDGCLNCERAQPAQEQWNAALDEAASRIGEIKGFGKATQDSFAVYIKGLKR